MSIFNNLYTTILENLDSNNSSLINLVSEFLNKTKNLRLPKHQWLESPEGQLYIRSTIRSINGQPLTTIDIANIEITNKGQKLFTRILDFIETNTTKQAIYVESILNERLIPFLTKRGYTLIPNSSPPSMYKIIHK